MRRAMRTIARLLKILLKLGFWSIAAVAAIAVLAFVAIWRELTSDLPPVAELLDYRPPTATRVYAADGSQIGEFYVERRYLIPIDQVPDQVKLAFLAAEDADFYRHGGVNPVSIARAMIANLQSGGIVQGASTITQQVVKQLLLTPERTFERKIKELILAIELESKLSKDDILYLYLNHIYFGAGTYGISAAAQTLFNREVGDLSLAQAALLAGLPKAPSRHDPIRRPDSALRRQRYVLERMAAVGFITAEERDKAIAEPLHFANTKMPTYAAAPWYVEQVRRLLEEQYGPEFADLGLHVQTAVDLKIQSAAEETLRAGLRTIERRLGIRRVVRHLPPKLVDEFLERQRQSRRRSGPQTAVVTRVAAKQLEIVTPWENGVVPEEGLGEGDERHNASTFRIGDILSVDPGARGADGVMRYTLDDDPQIEGALIAIEPESGQVKALVGGVDFQRSEFNRAVLARRQPGSAFKPLLYAAAIDHGYTAASIVQDAPISLPDGRHGYWTPKNFHNKYMGPVSLRTALVNSLNSVSVRLALDIGIDPLREYLRIFRFSATFPRNYSLALGTSEVTPFELTRAYGIFATLGRRFEPVFITAITDSNGEPVDFPGSQPRFEPVMKPATAYVVTQMMESVVETGTARHARALGRPRAGKTGTTNESKDAWFIGFTPQLLAGVWVGFDAEQAIGKYTGGQVATPIWTAFMTRALEGQPERDFDKPGNVSLVQVDAATGLKAVPGRTSRTEVFIAGTEPTRFAPPRATPTPALDEEQPAAATQP
jgi:penicillin-binding protein 1A